MYYYFCSDYPSVLKINGIYYGSVFNNVKSINIESESAPFIEICSLIPTENSINLVLDQEFLNYPPENVLVTDLKGGYMLRFNQCFNKQGFNILAQKKYSNAVVTVFNENGLKISIETPNDFFALPIAYPAQSAKIDSFFINSTNLISVSLYNDKTLLYIFTIENKIEQIFFRQVNHFTLEDQFTTTENLFDMAKHSIKTTWTLEGNILKEKNRTITQHEKFDLNSLNEKLIPYAFLEQMLVGADISQYVSDNIALNVQMLPEYLGNFIGICPPPSFIRCDAVGLIYRKKQNVYQVEYFTFEIKNRKISNIEKIT